MRASTGSVVEMKKKFLESLFSEDSKYNSALMTKRKYDSIIEDVKRIKLSKKKEFSRDYRIIQRYDVLSVQGCEKLIQPLSDARHDARTFVHADELFDILHSTHLSTNHGGRDKMMKQLNKLYKNITQAQVRMFLNVCKTCLGKRATKGDLVKQVVISYINSRYQLGPIDYPSQTDDELAMANATSETQAVRNDPSSSFPHSQDVGVMEHPIVKQEVLSDGESPSVDTTDHSTLAFLPLKELITKLQSNFPQPSSSIKAEPEIPEQLPDPIPFSPVITNVGPVKPDPDGPDTNQFPSEPISSHEPDPDTNQFPSAPSPPKIVDHPNEEFDSFVASSLVDCQLGDDPSPTENGSSLRNDAHSSSSSAAGDEFELCDKCGSYTRKVYSATGRPMRKVRQQQQLKRNDCHSSCNVVCCDDSMCSMIDKPVHPRLAKFQAYGQVLAQRLHRLPTKTSTLVQGVIEELVFNAEDGMYDGYLSTKGVLKQRASARSLKQIGGFNGYED